MIDDNYELPNGVIQIERSPSWQREIRRKYPPCKTCGFMPMPGITQHTNKPYVETEEENQRELQFRRHQAHIARELLSTTPVEILRKRFHVSEIERQFGQWAVTSHGVECLTRDYDVPRKRLFERYSWETHMAEKTWVIMEDFSAAIRHARVIYRQRVSNRTRYEILERDGFRCCQCGRTATDGVKLEIGHKNPVALGGPSSKSNLFTQCFDCNHGQFTKVAVEPQKTISPQEPHKTITTYTHQLDFDSDSCF